MAVLGLAGEDIWETVLELAREDIWRVTLFGWHF